MSELNFYTSREIAELTGQLQSDLNIDPVKRYIATTFPQAVWNDTYHHYLMVCNALKQLADYNTCIRPRWVWENVETPRYIYRSEDDVEEERVVTVAHPKRLQEYLDVFTYTARKRLPGLLGVVAAYLPDGVVNLKRTTVETALGVVYWEISWNGGPYANTNVLYVRREEM